MSNGHPPICDPVCQKILLDGDSLESAATDTCDMLKRLKDDGVKFADPIKVVEALIVAENATFHVQRVVMEQQGYSGPWPKCLGG